jgi:GAF domain-containing protein
MTGRTTMTTSETPSPPQPREAARQPLDAVLINDELLRRPYRGPDYEAENKALVALMQALAVSPASVLSLLCRKAMELCNAHSAGVSIEEGSGPGAVFRWHAIEGAWARYQGGTLPRWFSPCGTVLDGNAPALMAHPERHYDIPPHMGPPIIEALLVPFHSLAPSISREAPAAAAKPVGTVWVLAHDHGKRFDREDLRLMQSLAAFAGAARQAMLQKASQNS